MIYVLIGCVVCILLFAKMALVIIPQSETKIIERLGKYYATLQPGINFIIPFIDRAKEIVVLQRGRYSYTTSIDLREQVYDFPKQNVITKDNVQTEINALLYFQIVDPFKAVYEINNLPNAIEKLTQTTLRNIIGELELDQTLTSRDTINTKLRSVLDDATNKWGIKVNRVELQDITPPASVLSAMEKQMQAERNKRATILTSEGQKAADILQSEGEKTAIINRAEAAKQEAILNAEGEAQARIRKAEAEAIAIQKITEAVGKSTNPANYLLAQNHNLPHPYFMVVLEQADVSDVNQPEVYRVGVEKQFVVVLLLYSAVRVGLFGLLVLCRMYAMDYFFQFAVVYWLQQIVECIVAERRQHVLRMARIHDCVAMFGQNDVELFEELDTRHVGQFDIKENKVWAHLLGQIEPNGAVGCRTDNLNVVVFLQFFGQYVDSRPVVIDYNSFHYSLFIYILYSLVFSVLPCNHRCCRCHLPCC